MAASGRGWELSMMLASRPDPRFMSVDFLSMTQSRSYLLLSLSASPLVFMFLGTFWFSSARLLLVCLFVYLLACLLGCLFDYLIC